MANWCYYSMRVEGSPDNVVEFVEVLSRRGEDPGRHFYRIYEVEIDDPDTTKDGYVIINGYCAWSVQTSMMGDSASVYGASIKEYNEKINSLDSLELEADMVSRHNLIYSRNKIEEETPESTLLRESKLLSLTIEIFSEEDGMGFQEHYVVKDGELIVDEYEETEVYSTLDFDTVDEFNKEYELNISKEEFDINDDITIGGFYPWGFGQHEEKEAIK